MGTVATVLAMEFMVATEVTDLDTAIQSTWAESVRLKLSPRLPPNLTTTVDTVLAVEFTVATEVTDLDTAIQSTATGSVRLKLSPRLLLIPTTMVAMVDTALATECTEATEVTDLDTAVNSGAKPHSYLRHTVLAKLHIYCSSAINDKHFRKEK